MAGNFRSYDRDTLFLMPPSVQDWVPKDHLARFVVDMVEQLDLRPLRDSYSGRGSAAYHPEMLVALLFYAYATGVRASRKIERATYESVPFRYIAANTHPDHDTIAEFRTRFLPHLNELFKQLLVLAHEMGCLTVGRVSLDGTKVKANASKHRALSLQRAKELEIRLQREAKRMLELAEAADREDQPDNMDIPAEIALREDRRKAIKEAKERIKAREAERIARERDDHAEAISEREHFEETNGRRFRTKRPKRPSSKINPKAQLNLTDDESRIMPSTEGFVQAYNAQAGVDCASHLIVVADVSQRATDKMLIKPALQALETLPIGKATELLADAGYCSELNVERCVAAGITPFIAMKRDRHHWGLRHWKQPKPPKPSAGALEQMHYRLRTPQGQAIYAKRKSTVEPVFGNLKRSMGFRQFLLRGLEKVKGEWTLGCMAWNLRRLQSLSTA